MKNWSLTLHYAGEVIKEFLLPEGAFLIGTDASCGVVVEVEGVGWAPSNLSANSFF